MKYELREMIASEDKKNPYTDEKLAELCNVTREEVTILRQQDGILDSRERRRQQLIPEVQEILDSYGTISDRKLTSILNERGYRISRFIAKAVKEELTQEDIRNDIKLQIQPNKNFEQMIGFDGSMSCQISQAQAAILYPPKGIHSLIHGPSGVGKSQLAEAMYHFALDAGCLPKDAPFIVFNCADYAENAELLLSQLFGYVKGSFTGADSEKEGLIEKANKGILFLDEVHRLSSEGQEMLFYLIDKGLYRKLGETQSTRKAELLIIAATSEDLDSYLLTTFRRRIPMLIDLPPLSERPLSERFMLIKNFFHEEALRINKSIIIEKEVIKRLLDYPCSGNIGQLRSDIQVICARSFLKYITKAQKQLLVSKDSLPDHMVSLSNNHLPQCAQTFYDSNLVVSNVKHTETKEVETNIYQFIEGKYDLLTKKGLNETEIYEILGRELDEELDSLLQKIKYQYHDIKKLEEIVGKRVIHTVEASIEIANHFISNLSLNIISPLCLHVSASYDRLKCGKRIKNPQLEKIRNEYPHEFRVAKQMSLQYYKDLHIELPDDEVAFIAMYLKTFTKKKESRKGRIGIIVLTHGNVGMEMVAVANQLLHVNFAVGIRCGLDESWMHALQKTQQVVEELNEGKGCLILSDMGSLVTFGQIITEKTGIETRTISRVDTVMVIEAIRRAMLEETTLLELEHALNMEKEINFHGHNEISDKETVILSICLTGKGSAVLIQSEIQKILQKANISLRILTLGVISEHGLEYELDNLSRTYRILVILGNFSIDYKEIPFISTTDIIKNNGEEKLLSIISGHFDMQQKNKLAELLSDEIIICQSDEVMYKNDILEKLVSMLVKNSYVSHEYLLDVYKREAMGSTFMGEVAIPHGFTEHVTKPAIAILTLIEPIMWDNDFETNIILMPALQEENLEYTYELFNICTDKAFIQQLVECKNPYEIINKIAYHTKPSK